MLEACHANAGASDDSESGSQASEDEGSGGRVEREQMKRDVLMGHLLSLATQSTAASLPAHSLPALAEALCAKGLMPKWVQWSLTHQPALFDTAFDRLFSKVQSLTQTQAAFLIAAWPGEGLCAKSLVPNGPSHTNLHCLTPPVTGFLARYRCCLHCKLRGDLPVLSDSCLDGQ